MQVEYNVTSMAKKKKKTRTEKTGLLANRLVRQFLLQTAGENALKIVKEITQEMSDEDLARSCKLKVSDVRSVLNKLHGCGVAKYNRIKDKETGWYSYIWNIDPDQVIKVVDDEKAKKISEKADQAGEQTFDFYNCEKCKDSEKITFEVAMDSWFKCTGCGSQLTHVE